jgi:hypothetical protein
VLKLDGQLVLLLNAERLLDTETLGGFANG